MALNYQKINIVGNAGANAEMRAMPNGEFVTSMNIAVNSKGKDGAEQTIWFKVSVFGKLAETCAKYVTKGKQVSVWGKLRPINIWTDKEGNARATLEVTANEVIFGDGGEQSSAVLPVPAPVVADDMPF